MPSWAQIPGASDYEISSDGQVRSWRRRAEPRLLKPSTQPYGHKLVGITFDNGKRRVVSIHNQMLRAFVRPPEPGEECAHLDGNASNNTLSNLAWTSPKENQGHRRLHGTDVAGVKHYKAKVDEADVLEIRRLAVETELTTTQIGDRFGLSRQSVRDIITRRNWKHI